MFSHWEWMHTLRKDLLSIEKIPLACSSIEWLIKCNCVVSILKSCVLLNEFFLINIYSFKQKCIPVLCGHCYDSSMQPYLNEISLGLSEKNIILMKFVKMHQFSNLYHYQKPCNTFKEIIDQQCWMYCPNNWNFKCFNINMIFKR